MGNVENILVRVSEAVRRFLSPDRREDGQGMVEYALILVLIAVVVIIVLSTVGRQVKNVFSNVSNGLNQ